MRVMTTAQLEKHIEDTVRGTTFVSVLTETDPRMRKTGNPYMGTVKRQKKSGIIGFDYNGNVNAQAEREGKAEREAHARKWGVLSESRLFVHHKGQSYLQLRVQSVSDTQYVLDGNEIEASKIKPFLPERKVSSTQADLDKTLIVNDIKLANIQVITIGKETIALSHAVGATAQGKTKAQATTPTPATTN